MGMVDFATGVILKGPATDFTEIEEGKPISRYLVERALTVEPGSRGEVVDTPPELVLGAREQCELHENLASFAALMSEQMFQDDPLHPNLPAIIRALFETRLDEMMRTGRYLWRDEGAAG